MNTEQPPMSNERVMMLVTLLTILRLVA